MTAEVERNITPYDLCTFLDRFITGNARSRDVDERWLASELKPVLEIAAEVRNAILKPENRAKVNVFRAAELEAEIEKKRRETEVLERDLKAIKAA